MSSTVNLMLRGAGFRVLKTFVGIVIGFMMMPFLLNNLGVHLYGLWITIGSVVAAYYLLDLGFSQAVTRYVARYIHQKDYLGANKIIVTSLVIYSLLGLVVVLLSIFAVSFGADKLVENKEDLSLVKLLLLISGISLAFEFPAKAFPGVISAYMRFDTIAIVGLIKTIADAVLIYLVISSGYGLIAMSVAVFFTSLISTLFYVWYCTRLFKEVNFGRENFDRETANELFNFSKWVFISDLNALLKSKMDIWFIAYFTSLSTVAIYYVAVRLVEYAVQFLIQMTGMSSPLFAKYHALNEDENLAVAVLMFLKINVFLAISIAVGFYVFGDNFIRLWMGDGFDVSSAYLCLIVLGCGRLVSFITYPFGSLLLTVRRHDITAKVSVLESACSAILCIILIPQYELLGAAIAIALPLILGRVFLISVYAARFVKIEWVNVIARVLLYVATSMAVGWYVRDLVGTTNSYLGMLSNLVMYELCLLVIGLFVLFKFEELLQIKSKVVQFVAKKSVIGK